MNRRNELRKAIRQSPGLRPASTQRRVDPRREELVRALGVGPGRPYKSQVDKVLHKGRVVGPPWLGGIFQTRLNIGTLVLAFGVILFLVWLIMKRSEMGG